VRKIVIGAVGLIAGASTVLASGAFAGGNGAQRSGLSPTSGDSMSGDQCVEGSGAGSNGFVLVNAPGKPGAARFVNGEVSLKNDSPGGQMYSVWIKDVNNDTCMMVNTLTTNNQGNGNAHLNSAGTSGTYYVVLQDSMMQEKYASHDVTAN
jgi:hypothetical protein